MGARKDETPKQNHPISRTHSDVNNYKILK